MESNLPAPQHTRASLKELLVKGQLEECAQSALEYAQYCGLADVANGLTLVSSRLSKHKSKRMKGLLSFEQQSQTFATLSNDLLLWIDSLPQVPKAGSPKRKLLTEAKFKQRIFLLIILVKVIVFWRLWRHYSTGGFNMDQFQSTATLLLPTFAGYLTVIIASYIRDQKKGITHNKYIAGPLITFSYFLFPIYAILMIVLLENKPDGTLSFQQMNFWMAMVESILGGYIGQIVYSFFKKED